MNEEGGTRKSEGWAVPPTEFAAEPGAPAFDIKERTLAFGVRAVRLFRVLNGLADGSGAVLGRQFLRSATSVGANVAEARAAESVRDFLHKLQIAQKEARETLYWLRLMAASDLVPEERLSGLTAESDEILRILVAIARNTKRNART